MSRFVPPPTAAAEPFWEATRDRRLILQWCDACERTVHYPRSHCPHCGASEALVWRDAPSEGRIYAVTMHHLPGQTWSGPVPYVVALVELEGGARLMTNIVGMASEGARVGNRVLLTWEPLPDGRHLPLFSPEP